MITESRKQREIRQREKDILDTALALFWKDKLHRVTMEDLAAEVGISKGTLYNHFASKDDVCATIAVRFSSEMAEKLRDVSGLDDPEARLEAMLGVLWDGWRGNQSFRRVAAWCDREGFRNDVSPEIRAEMERADAEMRGLLVGALEHGVARGRFRAGDLLDLVTGPSILLLGLARFLWANDSQPAAQDPRFQALVRFVLSGLAGAAAAPQPSPDGSSPPD
ncbi:TetR family transcriptional regulator [bacterium]|nr:TetR family transcriptional regulator [bacterium]